MEHVGIDLHQKYSEICCLSGEGEVILRRRIPTTEASLRRVFARREPCRIVIESCSQAPWVARLLGSLGQEVVVVNPRRVRLIAESTLKNDAFDAEILARLGRFDLELLGPVHQRSEASQLLRTRLRVRGTLVKSRTAMINMVRGSLRSAGIRMGSSTAAGFVARFTQTTLPKHLLEVLDPVIETIAELSARIAGLDEELVREARSDELLRRLQTVPGVGPLVSLAYVGWMDQPERFRKSRDVGACLGLRPRIRDSGGRQRRGHITREGDKEMRRLLVQAAHASLQCQKDSALKRWTESLAERVGKKKAVVATARKIAVLLHRLWVTGDCFQPFPNVTAAQ